MLTTHFGIMLDSLRSSRRIYDCNRNQKHKTNLANNREGAASMDEFEQDTKIGETNKKEREEDMTSEKTTARAVIFAKYNIFNTRTERGKKLNYNITSYISGWPF